MRARALFYLFWAAAAMGGCGGAQTQGAGVEGPIAAAPVEDGVWVYQQAAPSVVEVRAGWRTGAGFLLEGSGEVLTAAHVVRDAAAVEVRLYGEDTARPAQVVGYDERADVALLSVTLDGRPSAARGLALWEGTPQALVGAQVWTIGHPDGAPWAVSAGALAQVEAGEDSGSAEGGGGGEGGPRLLHGLAVSRGSSGGPLLRREGARAVVVGMVVRAREGGAGWSVSASAQALARALPGLRAGGRVGLSAAQIPRFLALAPQRGPLSHQLVVARHVHGQAPNDHIEGVLDTLTVGSFPAAVTLHAWTTWRHFFAGDHTYRYRVVRLPDGAGDPGEQVHAGPTRTFRLENPEDSFVHQAQLGLTFPRPGLYALLVDTDGATTRAYPLQVRGPQGEGIPTEGAGGAGALEVPAQEVAWPSAQRPLVHAMLLVQGVDAQPDPSGQASLSLTGTFNEYRPAPGAADPLRFFVWLRWGYGFAGDHTFQVRLVSATGEPIAATPQEAFSLPDALSSFQATIPWSVRFPGPGLYFVLCLTDGAISQAHPIWVR